MTYPQIWSYVFYIITGFICIEKEVKQVVLINHSWLSLTIQRGWGWSSVNSPKSWDGGKFSSQKKERLLSLCLLIQETLQSKVYTRVTSFNKYPYFWEGVLVKSWILELYIVVRALLVSFRNRNQDFSRGCWKGDKIFRYIRFSFAGTRKILLEFSFFISVRYIFF